MHRSPIVLAWVLLAACRDPAPPLPRTPTSQPTGSVPALPQASAAPSARAPAEPEPTPAPPAGAPAPPDAPLKATGTNDPLPPGIPASCASLVRGADGAGVTLAAPRPGGIRTETVGTLDGSTFVRATDAEERNAPECLRAIRRRPSWIVATSSLPGPNGPSAAIDGDPATAWIEGAEGPGVGQGLLLGFDGFVTIDVVTVTSPPDRRAARVELEFFFAETDDEAASQACLGVDGGDHASLSLTGAGPGARWFNLTDRWLQHQGHGHVRQVAVRIADTTAPDAALAELAFYDLQPMAVTPGCSLIFE